MVRIRPSPDRRHPVRAPGGLRGDAGIGRGGQDAARDAGDPVREGAADGRSLRRLQRRPRSRQRAAEEAALGQVGHPAADRHAADVAAEKEEPDYDPSKPITRPLFPDRADVVVHDERGRVSCVCPRTGEVRAMAYQGLEADRGVCGTIKYRCPAAAFGFDCAGSEACHRAGGVEPGEYGRIVRIDLDKHDRRIFTPTPWGSPSWRRGYNRRSAMERINSRLDNSFNFETHYIRGLAKMKTRVGLALAVMMALAPRAGAGRARGADALIGRCGAVPRHRLTVVRPPTSPLDPAVCRQTASRGHLCHHVPVTFRLCAKSLHSAHPAGPQAVDIRPPKISGAPLKNATAHIPQIT